jgi:hypothetical protein
LRLPARFELKGRIERPSKEGSKRGAANPPATASLPLGHLAAAAPFPSGDPVLFDGSELRGHPGGDRKTPAAIRRFW